MNLQLRGLLPSRIAINTSLVTVNNEWEYLCLGTVCPQRLERPSDLANNNNCRYIYTRDFRPQNHGCCLVEYFHEKPS